MAIDFSRESYGYITFTIGDTQACTCRIANDAADGKSEYLPMDTAAVIVNDRTYAPIRYSAEFFDRTVSWNAATKTVSITG